MVKVPVWLAAAAVVAMAGPAHAERKKISEPDWLERPSPEEFAEHYPGIASSLGIEGLATISCDVNTTGKLVGCEVVAEAPRDLGFGTAALAISSEFKMKPQMENGVPVEGGEVRVPIRFILPKVETPPTPPPETSAAALEQARRMVDALGMTDRQMADAQKYIGRGSSEGIAAPVRHAGEEALRNAWTAHRAELRDVYARALASVFSEEEMAGVADFAAGRGKGMMVEDKIVAAELLRIGADMPRSMRAPAYAAFCAKVACPAGTELERVWRPIDARDGRLDTPQWSRAPGEYAVNRAAPSPAGLVGLTGAVRMTCRIEKDGKLTSCAVDEELPRGLGYGAAAVKLGDDYRLSPIQLATGAAGRKVTVRVGFTPTVLGEGYKPPKPRSDAAVDLARKLVVANESIEITRRNIEVQVLGFESKKPKTADDTVYDALIEAYRTGAMKAAEAAAEQQVQVWAALRSEGDLTALAAFQASPGGKAMRERSGAADVASRKAYAYVMPKIVADARAMFCKDRACDVPPPVQATVVNPEPSTRKP